MPEATFTRFPKSLFGFLDDLEQNNNRTWFQEHKLRYEQEVREPSLAFVRAFRPQLKKISPFFQASDKKVGGALMRVYRDTRFSKDKTPYKTNAGIHFRHEMCGDVHAPGFYVHLAPDACFLGVGIWHPDSQTLGKIRAAIDDAPAKWKRARDQKRFRSCFQLEGDSLSRPPRGYEADHVMIEDLKRKDHTAMRAITRKQVLASSFLSDVGDAFAASRPYMRWLCNAIGVPF